MFRLIVTKVIRFSTKGLGGEVNEFFASVPLDYLIKSACLFSLVASRSHMMLHNILPYIYNMRELSYYYNIVLLEETLLIVWSLNKFQKCNEIDVAFQVVVTKPMSFCAQRQGQCAIGLPMYLIGMKAYRFLSNSKMLLYNLKSQFLQ